MAKQKSRTSTTSTGSVGQSSQYASKIKRKEYIGTAEHSSNQLKAFYQREERCTHCGESQQERNQQTLHTC